MYPTSTTKLHLIHNQATQITVVKVNNVSHET